MRIKPPSSSGLGHLSFKEATGIRIPLGVLRKNVYNTSLLRQIFYKKFKKEKRITKGFISLIYYFYLFGSMLERLMGTDCKSAGNAYAGSNPARPKVYQNL